MKIFWQMLVILLWGFIFSISIQAGNLNNPDDLEGGANIVDINALEGDTPESQKPANTISCQTGKVCIETSTQLPMRVLPRPFSHLYKDPEYKKENIVKSNMPAFHPLYMFAQKDINLSDPVKPEGWYQVGQNKTQPEGWMRAADVFEWRQALLLSYTHPGDAGEGRNPALMFSQLSDLKAVVESDDMSEEAAALYTELNQGNPAGGVISMEPKRFVDINRSFYLLPILQAEKFDIDGDDARYLQLAAAVPGARGADTLSGDEYAAQALADPTAGAESLLKEIQVDVVFVIDTTRSMQPYIDMTRDAMVNMAKRISDNLSERVRFGLVGYRDSIDIVPKLEYVSKNFTPEFVDAVTLTQLLTDTKASIVGSHDYKEEVFAGIESAINSPWRENSMRFIILLGDASSHPRGHVQNTTGKGADDLLLKIEDYHIHLSALHLQDPRAAKDFSEAETQFRVLSEVRGSAGDSAYSAIDISDKQAFAAAVDMITNVISGQINGAMNSGNTDITKASADNNMLSADTTADIDTYSEDSAGGAFNKAWKAAMIEYLGQGARPPKDITAWVIDRDLIDPSLRTLDVRLLINRAQLSSLVQALDRVIQGLLTAEVTQQQFFDALQGVAGQAMKRPEDLGQAQRMVDTGLLPAFIASLPYTSDILNLSEEQYASMSPEQRSELQWKLMSKLKQYRQINEEVNAWQKLNISDTESDMVYPMNIDYLP